MVGPGLANEISWTMTRAAPPELSSLSLIDPTAHTSSSEVGRPASDYAILMLADGMVEFISQASPIVNGLHVEPSLKRSFQDLLYGLTSLVLTWDSDVLEQRTLPVEEVRLRAEADVAKIVALVQAIPQDRVQEHMLIESGMSKLLSSKRHAPLFWAWQTRSTAPTSRRKRLNQAKTIREALVDPAQFLLARYLGEQGKIPASLQTIWPTIGTRFRELSVVPWAPPQALDQNIPNSQPLESLPFKAPSVAIALSNACWAAAEQAWQQGPRDAETATVALHALCVGMTHSDVLRDHAEQSLVPLGIWAERLLKAGADPDEAYAYKYRQNFAARGPKAEMGMRVRTVPTGSAVGPEEERLIGVTASAMALAYTPGLVVTAQIERRRHGVGDSPDVAETWLGIWERQWRKQRPKLSFVEQDQDNPTNALFDAWLGSDTGRPHSQNGDYRLVQYVAETWGRVLKTYDKELWITRVEPEQFWGIKEALIALAAAPSTSAASASVGRTSRTGAQSPLVEASIFSLLEQWIPAGQSWPASLLTEMAQTVSSRLTESCPVVRQEQWNVLERLSTYLADDLRERAGTYLSDLQNGNREFLDGRDQLKRSGFVANKKKAAAAMFQAQSERMLMLSAGTLEQVTPATTYKVRTL